MDAISKVFNQMGIGSICDVACSVVVGDSVSATAHSEIHIAAQALIRIELVVGGPALRRLLACAMLNCDVTQTGKLYSIGGDGHVLCEELKDPDRAGLIKRLSGL